MKWEKPCLIRLGSGAALGGCVSCVDGGDLFSDVGCCTGNGDTTTRGGTYCQDGSGAVLENAAVGSTACNNGGNPNP
ncbi:hypothetical protein QUF80_17750 [Desulfococcaceae bacterium HSG8]|nr:hypothetical protein [Desulfococcaceae bacterium HSG8]